MTNRGCMVPDATLITDLSVPSGTTTIQVKPGFVIVRSTTSVLFSPDFEVVVPVIRQGRSKNTRPSEFFESFGSRNATDRLPAGGPLQVNNVDTLANFVSAGTT
jgi:hypothetical protein